MTQDFTSEDISEDVRFQIDEVRKRCASEFSKYPGYDTDFSIIRWLTTYNYDVDVVVQKIKLTISTYLALNLNKVSYDTVEEVNDHVKALTPLAEYFPGGLMGYDNDNNLIFVHAVARTDVTGLIACGRVSELFRMCTTEGELALKLVRKKESELGKKLGIKVIVDLEGFSLDMLSSSALKVYLNLLVVLQRIFPDFASQVFVVNCPTLLSLAYAAVKPVLATQIRERIEFLRSDWREKLCEALGSENVYPQWGGTKLIPSKANGKPSGTIRMGGPAPDNLRYENNNITEPDSLTTVNVPARYSETIEVNVDSPGKTLKWFFKCSSGDIDFGIKKNGSYVWPKYRLTTEFVPEYGFIDCGEEGIYELSFSNEHGKLWSKDIMYSIDVE
ncbi:hypothetical protein QR680_003965 [Steinernema hermaphroditum]|uniref:CRAL-TRIO domain-containing protein n=1 Tax=Steinernema hermaphroditum TaxID=289476 RepID=A0AA39HPF8_9BILA|nr:hypothetical protein QR680_003965 [Steinernema hermaphroditum]